MNQKESPAKRLQLARLNGWFDPAIYYEGSKLSALLDDIEAALTKQDAAVGRDAALSTALKIEAAGDALAATNEEIRGMARALLSNPWRSMESAPKGQLIDIWIKNSDGSGVRWADCYYDSICGQWRTSRPGGKLVWVYESAVTHWRYPPAPPGSEDVK